MAQGGPVLQFFTGQRRPPILSCMRPEPLPPLPSPSPQVSVAPPALFLLIMVGSGNRIFLRNSNPPPPPPHNFVVFPECTVYPPRALTCRLVSVVFCFLSHDRRAQCWSSHPQNGASARVRQTNAPTTGSGVTTCRSPWKHLKRARRLLPEPSH